MSQALLSKIADEGIEYVDIRFTDPRGKLQHVTVCADQVDQDFLDEGFMFDGSSIAGWKSIEESDMKLMPDVDSAYIDPFYAEKTICIHCTVVEPDTGESYARDPRGSARMCAARGSLSYLFRDRRCGLYGARGRILPIRRRSF